MYADAFQAVRDLAAMARPPVRMKVSESAAKYVYVRTAGGGSAKWDPDVAHELIEPMNMLTSREHEAVIFAGPARSSKTQSLVDCWIGHNVMCDPGDMLIVQMSQEKGRDYSKLRVNRMLRNSPEIGAQLAPGASGDNTFDKWFRSGMALRIGWPTINQLSSNDFRYVALTDYDRMPQDIDKEGSPFNLGQKRTQTFLSRGMTLAESSPGFEVKDPNWKPSTPHEAPSTRGIMSLYNQGDRRRRYWCCPHCHEYYMQPADIAGFAFQHSRDLFGITDSEIVGQVGVVCVLCGSFIGEEHKERMRATGVWVPEGMRIEREGREYGLVGEARKSTIASFWMPGAMAAYQTWTSIVQRYLNALRQYELTGDEEALKATTNVDQGAPYLPRVLADTAVSQDYTSRIESYERYTIPDGVRALFATVDVQGGKDRRFEVGVYGVGLLGEKWIINRFKITDSARTEDGETVAIDPASRIEDWDVLTEKVVNATYRLPDGREMRPYRIAVDSGGEDGVTDRAYEWWRGLRKKGLHRRVRLVKGASTMNAPKVKVSYPDSSKRSDRKAKSRGDIPVLLVNTDKIKDAVYNDLQRTEPGPGYFHFPNWLQQWFFDELQAERRGPSGKWIKVSKRNESFDLLVYLYALLFDLGIEKVNWNSPPAWLRDWDQNIDVITAEERREIKAVAKADSPAPTTRQARFRFD